MRLSMLRIKQMYIIFLYVELNHIVVIKAKKNDASDGALLIWDIPSLSRSNKLRRGCS